MGAKFSLDNHILPDSVELREQSRADVVADLTDLVFYHRAQVLLLEVSPELAAASADVERLEADAAKATKAREEAESKRNEVVERRNAASKPAERMRLTLDVSDLSQQVQTLTTFELAAKAQLNGRRLDRDYLATIHHEYSEVKKPEAQALRVALELLKRG